MDCFITRRGGKSAAEPVLLPYQNGLSHYFDASSGASETRWNSVIGGGYFYSLDEETSAAAVDGAFRPNAPFVLFGSDETRDSYTLYTIVKEDQTNYWSNIIAFNMDGTKTPQMNLASDDRGCFAIGSGSAQGTVTTSTRAYDAFHCCALTFNDGCGRLYVDGSFISYYHNYFSPVVSQYIMLSGQCEYKAIAYCKDCAHGRNEVIANSQFLISKYAEQEQ